jgi:hypothetical protein
MGKVEESIDKMIANLPEKTGKSIDQWIKVVGAAKLEKHGEVVAFLKTKHSVGHGYANLIAHSVKGGGAPTHGDDPLGEQYKGPKAALRPIYDAIVAEVKKFGSDLEISPKKANVSLRRSKQFALLQPSTPARFDVGINLKGEPPAGRLEASGSFSAMVTHRVRLESAKDVDKQLVGWLKKAYDAA